MIRSAPRTEGWPAGSSSWGATVPTATSWSASTAPSSIPGSVLCRDIYSGHPPPLGGKVFLSQLKNREEFEGGLEKKKGKGGIGRKKKRVIKHKLKYLYEA